MNGKTMLWIDQYGGKIWASTVKELHEKAGGRVSKMYRDTRDGRTIHVGYVVGNRWFTGFIPLELAA